jgi:hypothetical protein
MSRRRPEWLAGTAPRALRVLVALAALGPAVAASPGSPALRAGPTTAPAAAAMAVAAAAAAATGVQPVDRRPDPDVVGAITQRWGDRLSALTPDAPRDYFELAEEINDLRAIGPGAVGDPLAEAERVLVRRLFALAGRLDPSLTAAAARAIADITEDGRDRRRLLVVAELVEGDRVLQGRAPRIEGVPTGRGADASPAVLRAVSSSIARYRRGEGEAALTELADVPESTLAAVFEPWPGGLRGFQADCRRRPGVPTVRRLLTELSAERRMLEGDGADWAAIVRAGGGAPLEEVDVSDLDRLFGVDAARPQWRDGAWVAVD